MRWFKHMAASWHDEGLAKLVDRGGMEGLARYGLFWRVVEIVADQLDPKGANPTVCYSITRWSLLLSLRGSLVFSTLSTLGVTGGVTVERAGDDVRVTVPNLLKYRDEYSKKSGHTPESVGPKNRTDADTELEKKPSRARKARAADSRHQECREAIRAYWNSRNSKIEMPWDGSEGKALGTLLSASPDLNVEKVSELLRNRYRSEVNHSDRPSLWLRSLLSYASGPIDRYGKPLSQAAKSPAQPKLKILSRPGGAA